METFDSQGRILPIGAADQTIVSAKLADKNGQGQGPQSQPRKRAALAQPPEEKVEETLKEDHAIDILV
jgi:hypothetical protein